MGLRNIKRFSLSIKDVVADAVGELFGVMPVQTVPTSTDTARNLLTIFMAGRYQVSEVRECVV